MKRNSTIKLIEKNAQLINEYEQAVKEQRKSAVDFQAFYDQHAFPGGLTQALELLKKHDANTIDIAIDFLVADPYFFRSGYIKETILRVLKKAPLSQKQRASLKDILLAQLMQKPRREFLDYCRLAAVIADDAFKQQVLSYTQSDDNQVKKQAQTMLEYLK